VERSVRRKHMNAYTRYPLRLTELDPFEIKVAFETSKLTPCNQTAPRTAPLPENLEPEAQFGCVDWYQYHHEADETHLTK
jgi:hypothetical protein